MPVRQTALRASAASLKPLAIFALLPLTACFARPQDLSWSRPALVMEVNASPDTIVAKCFTGTTGKISGRPWETAPYRGGKAAWIQYTIAHVVILANITPSALGSRVEVFNENRGRIDVDDATLKEALAERETPIKWPPTAEQLAAGTRRTEILKGVNVPVLKIRDCLRSFP